MLTVDQFMIITKGLKEIYRSDKFFQSQEEVLIWYEYLKDIEYDILTMAVHKYICNEKFPPKISDLRTLALEIGSENAEWGDGWQSVLDNIRKYGYYQEKLALDHMDEVTRKVVKNLGWQNICMSENQMTDRANFRDLYNAYAKREREDAKLPQSVRMQIENVTNNNLIEERKKL